MPLHGVGIDIVDVRRIARLVEDRGPAFTGRWFTADEVAQCSASEDPGGAYAARFAGKEAVWKSLGMDGDRAVPWRSIGILDTDAGASVSLGVELATAAMAVGVGSIAVSTSAIDDLAMAVAMAWRTD